MEENRKEIIAKLNTLANGNKNQWFADATWRAENSVWLIKLQATTIKILRALRKNNTHTQNNINN